MPMVVRSTPLTVSHACSVAPVSASGRPEEKPSSSSRKILLPRNTPRSSAPEAPLIVDDEGGVVGKAAPLVDRLAHGGLRHAGRGDLVVDAPADVLRPGLAAVRPPGVLLGLLVQAPEHVDEPDVIEHLGEPGALLGQEAGVLLVRAPVPQVYLLVRDVPVAAQDDFAPAAPELPEIGQEDVQEAEFGRL